MPGLIKLKQFYRRDHFMHNTTNSFIPFDDADTWKWIGKLVLTIAAGIILSQFGVKVPDDFKL